MNQKNKGLLAKLAELRMEHGDLDGAIKALEESGPGSELKSRRLKKRKLQLKDEIVRIENFLTPDIIA